MSNSKSSKAIFINIVLSVFGMFLNMGINMVLTPYITSNIGIEGYGFIILSNVMVNYAEVISVALNSLAARYIAVAYYRKEIEKANQYYSSVLLANMLLSAILMIISGVFVDYLERIINVPIEMVADVKLLVILVAINYILMMIGTTFNVAAFIKNRLDITSGIRNLSYVIKAVALVLLFTFWSEKIWQVPVATIIATLFVIGSTVITTKKLTPELKFNIKNYSGAAIKEILKNGIWNSVNSLGVMLNSGLDLIVTNILLNVILMGQLSITKNISSIFNTFIAMFAQAFRPIQLDAFSQNNKKELIDYFNMSIKVTGFICGLIFASFCAIGYDFLNLWIPGQDTRLIYNVLIIVLIGDALGAITYPLNYVFMVVEKLKLPSIINIINGLINVILMIVLIKITDWGIYAVVITTAVLNVVVQFVVFPILACNYLSVNKMTFVSAILRSLLNSIILTIIFQIISSTFFQIQSWSALIACGCLLVTTGISFSFILLFNKREKLYLLNTIKSYYRK